MSTSRTTPVERTRIGGSKVRTGCITCKARRVKCDEARPYCLRCIRAGRSCGGYIAPTPRIMSSSSRVRFVYYATPDREVSPRASCPSPEQRALSYFSQTAATDLGRPFGLELWSQSLMRMSEHEPAVRSGLIALSSFHELYVDSLSLKAGNSEPLNKLAWEHYGQMITASKALTDRPTENIPLTALVTCLLFCAIESLRGHYGPSLRFVNQGVGLLTGRPSGRRGYHSRDMAAIIDIDELSPMFLNMSTQSMAISGEGKLEFTALHSEWTTTAPNLCFNSPEHGLAEISLILNDFMHLSVWATEMHQNDEQNTEQLHRAQENLEIHLDNWTIAFRNMLEARNSRDSGPTADQDEATMVVLEIYRLTCHMFLSVCLVKPQAMAFDQHLAIFQEINAASKQFLELEKKCLQSNFGGTERPHFSFTFGVIPPLYLVCSRCRDPPTRYEALRLLKSTKRRENLWDATLSAQAADMYIRLEEHRAKMYHAKRRGVPVNSISISSASDIPIEARVEMTESSFSDEDWGQLTFTTAVGETEAPLTLTWDT